MSWSLKDQPPGTEELPLGALRIFIEVANDALELARGDEEQALMRAWNVVGWFYRKNYDTDEWFPRIAIQTVYAESVASALALVQAEGTPASLLAPALETLLAHGESIQDFMEPEEDEAGAEPMDAARLTYKQKQKRAGAQSAIFSSSHSNVTDGNNHFPIPDLAHARNALARVAQYSAAPKWWSGTLDGLKKAVATAVYKKYPGLKKRKQQRERKAASLYELLPEEAVELEPEEIGAAMMGYISAAADYAGVTALIAAVPRLEGLLDAEEMADLAVAAAEREVEIREDGRELITCAFQVPTESFSYEDDGESLSWTMVVGQVDTPLVPTGLEENEDVTPVVFPRADVEGNFERIRRDMSLGRFSGEADHPPGGVPRLRETCVVWDSMRLEGNNLVASGRTTTNAAGKDVRELVLTPINLQASVRGWGRGEKGKWEGGQYDGREVLLARDYLLQGVDIVTSGLATTGIRQIAADESQSGGATMAAEDKNTPGTTEPGQDPVAPEETTTPPEGSEPQAPAEPQEPAVTETPAEPAAGSEAQPAGAPAEPIAPTPAAPATPAPATPAPATPAPAAPAATATAEPPAPEGDVGGADDLVTVSRTALATEVGAAIRAAMEEQHREVELMANIDTVLAGAELDDAARGIMRRHYDAAQTPEDVQRITGEIQPVLDRLAGPSMYAPMGQGIIAGVSEDQPLADFMADGEGNIIPRPDDVGAVVNALCAGLQSNGREDASNDRWVFETILANYGTAKNVPGGTAFLHSMTRSGYRAFMAATQTTSAMGLQVPQVLPMLRMLLPRLIYREVASIQPMKQPTARVYWLSFTKMDTSASTHVRTTFDYDWADRTTEATDKQQLGIDLDHADIEAREKAIYYSVSMELIQDLASVHGVNCQQELLTEAVNEIAREVNMECLTDMWDNATGGTQNFGTLPPAAGGWTQDVWYDELINFINVVAATIRRSSSGVGPNFLVCDPMSAALLGHLNVYETTDHVMEDEFGIGLRRLGTLANIYRVYQADWFTEDSILVGYKGNQWLRAGYVYAPYIPLYVSPEDYRARTNVSEQSVTSRYGTYYARPSLFGKISVQRGTVAAAGPFG